MASADDFPRLHARTRRFTLGRPRSIAIADDGSTLLFLRSLGGEDPVNRLWELDLDSGEERVIADPVELLGGDDEGDLPPEERARRERAREGAGGIVAFAGTRDLSVVAFALSGRVFVARRGDGWSLRELPVVGPAFDPHPDPTGRWVAYASGRGLHLVGVDGGAATVAAEDDPDVSWGIAEFVAAEEFDRLRGYWWAPDGRSLLAARVDESAVATWYIADPVHPDAAPTAVRYPAAGTTNADVSLHLLDIGEDGRASRRTEVAWDRERWPYLLRVQWPEGRAPVALVQTRDQTTIRVVTIDTTDGTTSVLSEQREEPWLEPYGDLPRVLDDGRVASRVRSEDTFRLAIDGEPVTPVGWHVRALAHAGNDHLVVLGSEDPAQLHVLRVDLDGGAVEALTSAVGWHGAVAGGDVLAITASDMDTDHPVTRVLRAGQPVATLRSDALAPPLQPRVRFFDLGGDLRAALLLPSQPGDEPLPVLLDPYGGPHGTRVLKFRAAHLSSQWFAEQGFAVLVIDGRGMPGRPSFEDAVHLDLSGPVLEDQVRGLHEVAALEPRLDLSRVGIRGWSFGGYLAAMAVLRRPDVFHAAVSGAPVTDLRLYDTHYQERYMGHPDEHPDVYRRDSLLDDAPGLERPLLIIHGMADDNVLVAHSLRLSRALMEAGRPHTFLPLSGVTHMTPQEEVAENLLRLQLKFLQDALAL